QRRPPAGRGSASRLPGRGPDPRPGRHRGRGALAGGPLGRLPERDGRAARAPSDLPRAVEPRDVGTGWVRHPLRRQPRDPGVRVPPGSDRARIDRALFDRPLAVPARRARRDGPATPAPGRRRDPRSARSGRRRLTRLEMRRKIRTIRARGASLVTERVAPRRTLVNDARFRGRREPRMSELALGAVVPETAAGSGRPTLALPTTALVRISLFWLGLTAIDAVVGAAVQSRITFDGIVEAGPGAQPPPVL